MDRVKVSQDLDLPGHDKRMLRGVCHLQFHDVPDQLFKVKCEGRACTRINENNNF